jgi:hypothetical protein
MKVPPYYSINPNDPKGGRDESGKPAPRRPLMSLQDRELFEVFDPREQRSSPVRSAT